MCSPQIMARVRDELQRNNRSVSRRRMLGVTGALAATGVVAPFAARAQDGTPITMDGTPIASGCSFIPSTIVDLSHTVDADFPVFAGKQPFAMEPIATFDADGYYGNILTFDEHTGTHMDSPAHFSPEGAVTADEIPVERFFVPLVVIDISAKTESEDDAALEIADIEAWEAANGQIPAGAFVASYSGWESRLAEPDAFINLDADGVQHYPGIGPDAAMFLTEERDIVGVGVDTVSLDVGSSTTFDAHVTILGSGHYGLETLANLGQVPPLGATLVVGGPKHRKASGGPTRAFAIW